VTQSESCRMGLLKDPLLLFFASPETLKTQVKGITDGW